MNDIRFSRKNLGLPDHGTLKYNLENDLIMVADHASPPGKAASAVILCFNAPLAAYLGGRLRLLEEFRDSRGWSWRWSLFCNMDGKLPIHGHKDQNVAITRARHLLYVLHDRDW